MSFPPSQAHRFNQTENRSIGTISLTRTGSVCVCICVYFSLQGEREDKVFYSDSDVQTVKNVNACEWISVQNINGTHLVHMVSEVWLRALVLCATQTGCETCAACVCVFFLSSLTALAWALCQSSSELRSCSQLRPLTSQFEAEPTAD